MGGGHGAEAGTPVPEKEGGLRNARGAPAGEPLGAADPKRLRIPDEHPNDRPRRREAFPSGGAEGGRVLRDPRA